MPTIGTPVATNTLSGALLTLSCPGLPDYGKWIFTYCLMQEVVRLSTIAKLF